MKKTLILFFAFLISFSVQAQKKPTKRISAATTADTGIQLISTINGVLKLGDLCVNNAVRFNAAITTAERAKYGSFTVYQAIKNTAGAYVPGKILTASVSFGNLSGSILPFTISNFEKSERVIIVFSAQDKFFENNILPYTFNSANTEVTNDILLTVKPFAVTINCNQVKQ